MPMTLPDDPVDAFDSEDGKPYSIGMTKRERFAMEAMRGLLGQDELEPESDLEKARIAAIAVDMADKLINELNQSESPHK